MLPSWNTSPWTLVRKSYLSEEPRKIFLKMFIITLGQQYAFWSYNHVVLNLKVFILICCNHSLINPDLRKKRFHSVIICYQNVTKGKINFMKTIQHLIEILCKANLPLIVMFGKSTIKQYIWLWRLTLVLNFSVKREFAFLKLFTVKLLTWIWLFAVQRPTTEMTFANSDWWFDE